MIARGALRVATLIVLSSGSIGHAQDAPTTTRTRFYNFDDLVLDGARNRPNLLYTDAKQRAKFGRLFSLKRSFLPELERTGAATVVTPGVTPE